MKKCSEVMTKKPVCCLPIDAVSKAAQRMKKENVGSISKFSQGTLRGGRFPRMLLRSLRLEQGDPSNAAKPSEPE